MEVNNNYVPYAVTACALGTVIGGCVATGAIIDNVSYQRKIINNKDEFINNAKNMKKFLSDTMPGAFEDFEKVAQSGKYNFKSTAKHAAGYGLGAATAGALIGVAIQYFANPAKHK